MAVWRVPTVRAIGCIAAVVIASRVAAGLPDADARVLASNVLMVATSGTAAAVAAWYARRATGAGRRHLFFLALAAGAWLLGQLSWTFAEVFLGSRVPFPSGADVGFVAMLPAAIAAMLVIPTAQLHVISHRVRLASGLIVVTAGLYVAWATLLEGALGGLEGAMVAEQAVSVSYVTGDAIVLGIAACLVAPASPVWRRSLAMYLVGFAALLTADAGFAFLVAQGTYATGSWIDLGWNIGWIAIAFGARSVPLRLPAGQAPVVVSKRASELAVAAATGISVLVFLYREFHDDHLAESPPFLTILVGIFFLAMIARTFLVRMEAETWMHDASTATAAMSESSEAYRDVLAAAHMITWTWDARTDRWATPDDAGRILAVELGGTSGPTDAFLERIVPADRDALRALMDGTTPDEPGFDTEFGFQDVDGATKHLRIRGRSEFAPDGRLLGRSGILFDVTESRAARLALQQHDEKIIAVAAFGARAATIDSLDEVIEAAVQVLRATTDADRCEVVRAAPVAGTVLLPVTWSATSDAARAAEPAEAEFPIRWRGAQWGTLRLRGTFPEAAIPERDALARGVCTAIEAAIERSASEQALWHEARFDALTGLPNRFMFDEQLQAITTAAPASLIAVAFMDLDSFKLVNDRHGHQVGDRVLQVVAERIRACLRPDDLVARLGGDEFGIVMANLVDVGAVRPVLARIQASLRVPIPLPGTRFFPRASIGYATTAETERTPAVLLRNADLAMYVSKAAGRGEAVAFEPSFFEDVRRTAEVSDAVRGALARDELVMYYQPVIDLRTGGTTGAEALVRWRRPGGEIASPTEFLDSVARLGLMPELTAFALHEATAWARARIDQLAEGDPFTVAVNVDASDLLRPTFATSVAAALGAAGLPADRLCLEITEAGLVADVRAVSQTLAAVREQGIKVAIDDFGTGFSSIAQLKRIPADFVKIDRSFVDGLGTEMDDSTVVAAIMRMAHTMSMDVIAEGVETTVQRDVLETLGCEMAQGYLFGRPVPPEEAGRDWPSARSKPARSRRGAAAEPPDVVRTVVIADDLEDDRRLLTRQLRRSGRFEVIGEAGDGAAAADLVMRLHPEIVLLDLNMPILDGIGAVRRIHAESPATLAILLSGFATDQEQQAAVEEGALGCIAKGPANIAARIEALLRRRGEAGVVAAR